MRILLCVFSMILAGLSQAIAADNREETPFSTCIALAKNLNTDFPVLFASMQIAIRLDEEVRISFSGHSTYIVETPAGVRIATDYAGFSLGAKPNIATMNNAHSSHFTSIDDPEIEFMLPGWGDDGIAPAKHARIVEDVFVRNVTSDINRSGFVRPNQNSIFIFEVAGLCIGHLGHLHHQLTDDHFAKIGRLDIVMVPIDGGLTMGHLGMSNTIKRLQSRIVLPMHRRGNSVQAFASMMGSDFELRYEKESTLVTSARTLPKSPTIIVLPGV